MRLLMWLLLGFLVYLALRKKTVRTQNSSPFSNSPAADRDETAAPHASSGVSEDMVCCARCQVFVPISEAVVRGRATFCCVDHADHPEHSA